MDDTKQQEHMVNQIIQATNERITATFDQKQHLAKTIDGTYAELLEELKTFVGRGGKRLRPLLCVLAYQGLGGTKNKSIYHIAASQELFHAFLLMHDDIIDRDETRYSGPNIAGRYRAKFAAAMSAPDTAHYSAAWAMLAGDVCLNLANGLVLASGFSAKRITGVLEIMHATLFSVIGGELLDVALSLPITKAPTEAQLLQVCRYKTASYSFVAPLKIGAYLQGANAATCKRIESFGRNLGIAYQLQDDLLGMFGDTRHTGKPVVSDLREGKHTLLMSYGLSLANASDSQFLVQQLGNPQVSTDAHMRVRRILTETGAQLRVESLVHAYSRKAERALRDIKLSAASHNILSELITRLSVRHY